MFFFSCMISKLPLAAVVATAERCIREKTPRFITTVNVATLLKMRFDSQLRRSILDADIVGANGVPLAWVSRLCGTPLPGPVNGLALMDALLECSHTNGYRVYFFGATEEIVHQALATVRRTYPGIRIAGAQHTDSLFPKEREAAENERRRVDHIRAAHPDILFLGARTFAQKRELELWAEQHLDHMQVPVCYGVGNSFEVLAGASPRAPHWMHAYNLAWLFYLIQEPSRLGRRYMVTNALLFLFVFALFRTFFEN